MKCENGLVVGVKLRRLLFLMLSRLTAASVSQESAKGSSRIFTISNFVYVNFREKKICDTLRIINH